MTLGQRLSAGPPRPWPLLSQPAAALTRWQAQGSALESVRVKDHRRTNMCHNYSRSLLESLNSMKEIPPFLKIS